MPKLTKDWIALLSILGIVFLAHLLLAVFKTSFAMLGANITSAMFGGVALTIIYMLEASSKNIGNIMKWFTTGFTAVMLGLLINYLLMPIVNAL